MIVVRMQVRKLFAEYLDSQGFVQFEPPCLIGAASEGGANVFQLPYFDNKNGACLAQSPQFYKQFEIAGGRKKVPKIRLPSRTIIDQSRYTVSGLCLEQRTGTIFTTPYLKDCCYSGKVENLWGSTHVSINQINRINLSRLHAAHK